MNIKNSVAILPADSGELSRRDFLMAATAVSAFALAGCATNPVTGESQLMLVDKSGEIEMDRANSPHQISADYGPTEDRGLAAYISQVGEKVSSLSHRPDMPFSFRVVDATYINAYAFPGGTVAATRGIMLGLSSEAELAALLGHEVGHVSARHTASRMSKALLTELAVAGLVVAAAGSDKNIAPLAAGLGALGAGVLLARYSRDDERQADALGMQYMVKAGYNPNGMVGLMSLLRGMSKEKPGALDMMFSTHPMSDERYQSATSRVAAEYAGHEKDPLFRERYMDSTAGLRRIKSTIELLQQGEAAMMKEKYRQAEESFTSALKAAPNDYAGLLMMSKCQLAQKKGKAALTFAERARQAKPAEPQSAHLIGMAKLGLGDFSGSYQAFSQYDTALPGNPNITFFKGLSAENMGDQSIAADEFMKYVQVDNSSEKGQYAVDRLTRWGYIKPAN